MVTKISETYWVKIYISGPLDVIEQGCRKECFRESLCITVDPTRFIYTGGEETGAVVGLVNYPRFPKTPEEILERARKLASVLLAETYQHSVMIQTPSETYWVTLRDDD